MKSIVLSIVCVAFSTLLMAQTRPINKLTLQTTYSQVQIPKALHEYVNAQKREQFFNDDFFNSFLKNLLLEKKFTPKEKVQIFYLMEKKIGYSFAGLSYLPPQQNYYIFHLSQLAVFEKTKDALADLKMDITPILDLSNEQKTNDPLLSGNALLLATLINSQKTVPQLRRLTVGKTIQNSKLPMIFNHYASLASSVAPDSIVSQNLKTNVFTFKQEGMIEDALCALYSTRMPLAIIKDYILREADPLNDLAIETALCALHTKVSDNAFNQNLKSMSVATKDNWKRELLEQLLSDKYPYNYSLTSDSLISPKAWDGVQYSVYTDGTLISYGTFLEFDPY